MTPLDLWFEVADQPQTFVHVKSADGILGHAQELRDRVPVGTWINIQPELQPTVTKFLAMKCGFQFMGRMQLRGSWQDILQKVE